MSSFSDPFEVKRQPKWHPRRLFYTAYARMAEAAARRNFQQTALPETLPGPLPNVPDVDWADTEVKPNQLGCLLLGLAATERFADTVAVEVGAYRGVTAAALASATRRKYVVVDPFIGYGGSESDFEIMKRRTSGIENTVHLRQTSGQASRSWPFAPASFVFIDAVHDYVNVRFDIAAWSARMCAGGILAFHDTDNPAFAGVRRAIHEIAPSWRVFAHVHDLVMLIKPE